MASPWVRRRSGRARAGHADFDRRLTELVDALRQGRWNAADRSWPAFAADLEAHLAFEERELFPPYGAQGATQRGHVRRLQAEHRTLRQWLETLAAEISMRDVHPDTIGSFADDLLAHSRREDETVYPWLEHRRVGP